MKSLRAFTKSLIRRVGYDVTRYNPQTLGVSLWGDLRKFVGPAPFVLDVGANKGQSVDNFKDAFPRSTVHSFEPSPTTFRALSARQGKRQGVVLNNVGVGREPGTLPFFEYPIDVLSSFLPLTGQAVPPVTVPVVTLDDYCRDIPRVDVLKVDTQGFDLAVLEGGRGLFRAGRIKTVVLEVTFAEMYEGAPAYHELLRFLHEYGFKLVSFYNIKYRNGVAEWCDTLFVSSGT